jgi:hypothetical protein
MAGKGAVIPTRRVLAKNKRLRKPNNGKSVVPAAHNNPKRKQNKATAVNPKLKFRA